MGSGNKMPKVIQMFKEKIVQKTREIYKIGTNSRVGMSRLSHSTLMIQEKQKSTLLLVSGPYLGYRRF